MSEENEEVKRQFHKGLTVSFKKDLSGYKTEKIIALISLIEGVESVEPVIAENAHDHINRQRVRVEYFRKFEEILLK